MEYSITYQGREAGSLRVCPRGLYTELIAQCSAFAPGVQRVWAVTGLKSRSIGVLAPEPGGLGFHRSVPSKHWAAPEAVIAGREEDGFVPWRGSLDGLEIKDGYIRQGCAALPFVPGAPVPMVHKAADFQTKSLGGRLCLVLPQISSVSPTGQ